MEEKSIHVLLIQDDPGKVGSVEEMLMGSRIGRFDVEATNDLFSALERMTADDLDVVLLDFKLVGGDGLDTLSKVVERASKAPVVLFVDEANEDLAIKALRAGAQDYLIRGRFDSHLLVRSIDCVVERWRVEQEREATIALLHLINSVGSATDLIKEANSFFCKWLRCDACEIRITETESLFRTAIGPSSKQAFHCKTRFLLGNSGSKTAADHGGELPFECFCERLLAAGINNRKGCSQSSSYWSNTYKELQEFTSASTFEPHFCHACMDGQWESFALIPLCSGKDDVGFLRLQSKKKGFFDRKKIALIEGMAGNIAVAVTQRLADEERRLFTSALRQAAEPIAISDAAGVLQYVNPAFEKVTGYGEEDVIRVGKYLLRTSEESKPSRQEIWGVLEQGNVWMGRITNQRKDGTLYQADTTISPVRNDAGEIFSYVLVERDVSHEVALERKLRQAQKMEAIGTLAGGIAHDFNNILGIIMGYTEIAALEISEDSVAAEVLKEILKATKRAKDLVKQILAFSRQADEEKRPLHVAPLIKEALKLLRASLPSTIEIRLHIDAKEDYVFADPTEIHQVLMNLCTNAAHAMREKGGILEIKLAEIMVDSSYADREPDLSPGFYLKLSVSDTGHGMDASVLDRIFDPYFTTKAVGEGTGLGLAVVHGIVKSHGGSITVYSEPRKGTTFNVFLPIVGRQPVAELETPPVDLGKGECVLFVDDELALVDIATRMLKNLGYEVLSSTSSVEAFQMFQAQPDRFDAVITDLTIPKMTGVQLAEKILEIRSEIPIILCTGFSEVADDSAVKDVGIKDIIMKPIVMTELAKILRKALGKETN